MGGREKQNEEYYPPTYKQVHSSASGRWSAPRMLSCTQARNQALRTCKHQVTVIASQPQLWLKRVWRLQDGFTHLTEDPLVHALLRKQACTALACTGCERGACESLHRVELAAHLLS